MTWTPLRFGMLLSLVVLGFSSAKAEELSIVDVRRHVTLADDDVIYKDFYLNGGEGDGLKKNLVVTAVRKIQVRDASGSQGYGEILVPVGQLRIIAIQGKIAVAREYKLLSRDELPMLEQTGLMSGDRIDLKGAFIDNKPVHSKKAVASHKNQSTTVVVATTTTATTAAQGAPTIAKTANRAPASVPASAKAETASPAKPNAPNTTSEAMAAIHPPWTAESATASTSESTATTETH